MKKILWVKFGWSDFYRGGRVDGNFGWLNAHRGTDKEARGHEAYNFMAGEDGTYYCYVPPQAHGYPPFNEDNEGWTVVCLAKNPKHKGIHIVGWYEDATLLDRWYDPPARRSSDVSGPVTPYDWSYCIESKSAYFISPELRTDPFSDTSVRQGKYSFLAGPGVVPTENKRRVLALLERKIGRLRPLAIYNPSEENAPNPELNKADPLANFGTPEHRKRVELAAEAVIKAHYAKAGYSHDRVASLNKGYDYVFSKGKQKVFVEVKGTSGDVERFFLTRNEHLARRDPRWRLAMVTNALDSPAVTIYDDKALKKRFDLEPLVYLATPFAEP